ncbi:MAG: hypothetical protein IT207_03650 [Fimbriimonadaceae bacterium]|nr:hypothetical protein [Fimbriimonadaceae bacterium]
MEWRVDWGRSRWGQRAVVALAALAAGVAGTVLLQSPIVGALAVAAVIASTAELFLPVRYRLTEADARSTCGFNTSVIRWADVKRLVPIEGGVRLSPLAVTGPMETFRGVVLRYCGNEREVLGKIGELWGGDAELLAERDGSDEGGGDAGSARP